MAPMLGQTEGAAKSRPSAGTSNSVDAAISMRPALATLAVHANSSLPHAPRNDHCGYSGRGVFATVGSEWREWGTLCMRIAAERPSRDRTPVASLPRELRRVG